jgi:hypothetical protein
VVIAVAGACAVVLAVRLPPRIRALLVGVAMAALLAAPATWAAETIGHATSGTFPTGGPASASSDGPGGFGGGRPGGLGGARPGGFGRGAASGTAAPFGGGAPPFAGGSGPSGAGGPAAGFGGGGAGGFGGGGPGGFGGGGSMFGGNNATLTAAIRYAKTHGGGTIGVSSQSSAAAVILSSNANVAGLGGFSGRESSVSATWLAQEIRSGHLRWVLVDGTGSTRLQGDTRTGSQATMSIVAKTCRAVTFKTSSGTSVTMYDCLGRASAILQAART